MNIIEIHEESKSNPLILENISLEQKLSIDIIKSLELSGFINTGVCCQETPNEQNLQALRNDEYFNVGFVVEDCYHNGYSGREKRINMSIEDYKKFVISKGWHIYDNRDNEFSYCEQKIEMDDDWDNVDTVYHVYIKQTRPKI